VSGDNIKAFYAFLVSVFALLGMVGVLGYFAMKTVSMSTIKYCRRRGGRHYPPASEPIALFLSLSLSLECARAACVPASARAYIPLTHAACCTCCVCLCAQVEGGRSSHTPHCQQGSRMVRTAAGYACKRVAKAVAGQAAAAGGAVAATGGGG
jgi:hypothetical protein